MRSDVVSLPANSRAASMARAEVRQRLRDWDIEELVDVVVLLTSELVTNVVVHTTSAPQLEVDRDGGGVRVTVTDASPTPPTHHGHSARAMTGRGLELVEELADDWGWAQVEDGKAVWFTVQGKQDPVTDARDPAVTRPAGAGTPEPPSPLGRYAAAEDSTVDPDTSHPGTERDARGMVTVRLLGVPVRVLAASREHHDGLMREFRLLALSGAVDGNKSPARLVALTQALGVRYAVARSRPDSDFDRAVELGLDTVDLTYSVPPTVVDGARELQTLMDEADRFSRSAKLITLPRTPVVQRFADWYVDQLVQQVAGGPATPWTGPLDPA